jgi:hypothetical protein
MSFGQEKYFYNFAVRIRNSIQKFSLSFLTNSRMRNHVGNIYLQ